MKTKFLFRNSGAILSLIVFAFIAVFTVRCTPPPPEEPVSDSYKKKLITYEESRVLFDEYSRTNNQILAQSRNGNPDSRWYWFSLEDMEGYIKYVKENAKKQNLKNPGIRIYLGKYPENHPAGKMAKPEYAGYQTIFLMPTAKAEKGDNTTLKRVQTMDENEDVQSIQPLNMTNLAPPPNSLTNSMN